MSYKIMMVDDNLQNLSATKDFLEAAGYEVATATTLEKAIELLNVDEFALILLDYQMPDMMGNVVAERIKKEYPAQQIAMFSCDLSREALKDSLDVGVVGRLSSWSGLSGIAGVLSCWSVRFVLRGAKVRTEILSRLSEWLGIPRRWQELRQRFKRSQQRAIPLS
jgi:CheY-like chemotaxis protein